jgi:DNA-directed RNA polymerase specialized sigma subunit
MSISIGLDIGGTKCAISTGECTEDSIKILSREEFPTAGLSWRQVLEELPPRDRALIEMRYLRRQTQQATADALGMTQVQVSRRERAILLQLRKKLLM